MHRDASSRPGPDQDAMAKVAGEVSFSLCIGSVSAAVLAEARASAMEQVARIEAERAEKKV